MNQLRQEAAALANKFKQQRLDNSIVHRSYDRMIEQAKHYAAFDKSDPFAFARCKAHISNGIADNERHYEAEQAQETRKLDHGIFSDGSNEYHVTGYRSIKRP